MMNKKPKKNVYLSERELSVILTALDRMEYDCICGSNNDYETAKEVVDIADKVRVYYLKEVERNVIK